MPWGSWIELEEDVHCKEWECIIEKCTEEKANTTMHQIYGQHATLSINFKPGDWDRVQACILKAGSDWHQAETAEDPQKISKFATGSLRSSHSAPHHVDTLGSISGRANATVAASVAS